MKRENVIFIYDLINDRLLVGQPPVIHSSLQIINIAYC